MLYENLMDTANECHILGLMMFIHDIISQLYFEFHVYSFQTPSFECELFFLLANGPFCP